MNREDWPLQYEPEFADIWKQVSAYTMTSVQRGYALWKAVNYIIDNKIEGSFVECGVWKGGSSMLIALTLKSRNQIRNQFLFDTFEGMTSPSSLDVDVNGFHASELMAGKLGAQTAQLVEARAGLEEVKEAILSTGVDGRCVRFIKGDVAQTLQKTQTQKIALLRLDTDFYESTKAELSHLYPRVAEGGVVIIDDYGHWKGAKSAVDEYFSNNSQAPMLWAIDYTGRGFIKAEPAKNTEIDRYDYIPPNMEDPQLSRLFPYAEETNPWTVQWDHLRPSIPHKFRMDTRNKRRVKIGNASYEEAVCLYNVAKQFSGKRGLEIGTHFGWTSAHLKAAGLRMDYVDPEFEDPDRIQAISEVLNVVREDEPYALWADYSPSCIPRVYHSSADKYSMVFIDGDHDGEAPALDARAVLEYCADDAVVMFHDMTSPHVAAGLSVLQDAGWNVTIFQTMQILGVAWRGQVTIPEHIKDINVPDNFYPHLERFSNA